MTWLWIRGLLLRRPGTFLATSAGIAIAVALLASLGSFLAAANGSMTERAVATVAVDWQVQVAAGADPANVSRTALAAPGVRAALPVAFAQLAGLTATTGGTTQTTGAAVALEIPPGYSTTFPGQVRFLTGRHEGVLLAQQTASNLHAGPGDRITIGLADAGTVDVTVDGVVDLPQANSLFQIVGASPQSQPIAPPDNVVLLPPAAFDAIRAKLAAGHADLISTQVHVARSHALPADPASAFTAIGAAAHNLDAALVGTGQVGDNLGAALDAARGDAAYATVLFLFLGLPGAVLSGMLTLAIANAARPRRRRDQALLRTRGGSVRSIGRLVATEAMLSGLLGAVVGLAGAALIGALLFGSPSYGSSGSASAGWAVGAVIAGLLIAVLAVLIPALRDVRGLVISSARAEVPERRAPWWIRTFVDLILIGIALVVISITAQNGYSIVLAPEGVAAIRVDYWAFFGPGLLWIGIGLLLWRLASLLLGRGRRLMTMLSRPIARNLAGTATASMARQRSLFASSIVMLALAFAFAGSTATFNATYQQQSEVDARLTNGADVTMNFPPGSDSSASAAQRYRGVAGVAAVEPLQHRFAYVGSDLQDLFGVRATSIDSATSLQDAYFQGGTAADLMKALAATPEAILVSAETVQDYQLHTGDAINLRLQKPGTGDLVTVPFRYIGIAKEFPTAPKDSFFVANADYVAQQTRDDSVASLLISTGGADPSTVADTLQKMVGTSASVVPIGAARSSVGSSLTSVDLGGLTRIELVFAFLLAAGSGGVVFALGLAERRRSYAIASVLGASRKQLRSLALVEASTVAAGGLVGGVVLGWALSSTLVSVLSGVFDPPPDALAVPWGGLAAIAGVAIATICASALLAAHRSAEPPVESLRGA
jgi:putative ABC transport system permease protein